MKLIKRQKYLMIVATLVFLTGCAQERDFDPHLKNPQNTLDYLNTKTAKVPIINRSSQQQYYQKFLDHYYSPWTGKNRIVSNKQLQEYTNDDIKQLTKDPGWGENQHKYNEKWANEIIINMAMPSYPNYIARAITTRATNLRLFPTNEPSFSALDKPGLAYPFDNFQESYVPANLPVLILQTTQDKAWNLIVMNNTFGWIKASDLALIDENFIKAWQNNQGYIEFKNDKTSVVDTNAYYSDVDHVLSSN